MPGRTGEWPHRAHCPEEGQQEVNSTELGLLSGFVPTQADPRMRAGLLILLKEEE